MSGFDKIISKINEESQKTYDKIIEEANNSASKIIADKISQAQEEKSRVLKKAEIDAAAVSRRIISTANLEGKKQILSHKQAVVESAFDEAYKKLVSLPSDKFLDLLSSMAAKEITSGDEEILISPEYSGVAQKLNDKIKEKAISFKGKVTVSDRVKDAGLVVKKGEIEVNKTFSAIIRDIREGLEEKIVSTLFKS